MPSEAQSTPSTPNTEQWLANGGAAVGHGIRDASGDAPERPSRALVIPSLPVPAGRHVGPSNGRGGHRQGAGRKSKASKEAAEAVQKANIAAGKRKWDVFRSTGSMASQAPPASANNHPRLEATSENLSDGVSTGLSDLPVEESDAEIQLGRRTPKVPRTFDTSGRAMILPEDDALPALAATHLDGRDQDHYSRAELQHILLEDRHPDLEPEDVSATARITLDLEEEDGDDGAEESDDDGEGIHLYRLANDEDETEEGNGGADVDEGNEPESERAKEQRRAHRATLRERDSLSPRGIVGTSVQWRQQHDLVPHDGFVRFEQQVATFRAELCRPHSKRTQILFAQPRPQTFPWRPFPAFTTRRVSLSTGQPGLQSSGSRNGCFSETIQSARHLRLGSDVLG